MCPVPCAPYPVETMYRDHQPTEIDCNLQSRRRIKNTKTTSASRHNHLITFARTRQEYMRNKSMIRIMARKYNINILCNTQIPRHQRALREFFFFVFVGSIRCVLASPRFVLKWANQLLNESFS